MSSETTTHIETKDPQPTLDLSIVIPAFNEAHRLPTSLRDLRSFFQKVQSGIEILVVVETSSDGTLEAARAAAKGDDRFVVIDNLVQRGKGYAVRSGMLKARGRVIFYMDADLSTPLAEVFKFLAHFNEHPDVNVIFGSRALETSEILKKQSWIRRNLGRSFNYFVQRLVAPGISDTQCGFKAFRHQAAQDIFTRQTLDGFAFDVEVLMLARSLGHRVDVLPVRWTNSPDSRLKIWRDPIKMFWDLLKLRHRIHRSKQA